MMSSFILTTPVVFLVFNRPETTARVFAAIREARPSRLFIVADGPRREREEDGTRCAAVRRIVEQVDWPCDIQRNYSDVNLGCKQRVASGLDWVFSLVEEAIILEDDCLPDPTFFRFCQELLEKYRDAVQIASIGGTNFQNGYDHSGSSYYFSRYNHIWGWATWKRSWANYDVRMSRWPAFRKSGWLYSMFGSKIDALIWKIKFDNAYSGTLDTWDYQWTFACWCNEQLSVIPIKNLVTNIGFGDDATHTKDSKCSVANMPSEPISYPLSHPSDICREINSDSMTQEMWFRKNIIKSAVAHLVCLLRTAFVSVCCKNKR